MNRFVVLAAAILFAIQAQAFAAEGNTGLQPPKDGDMLRLETYDAPETAFDVTLSRKGQSLEKLHDFKGKMVVLNLWATWCPPCIKELPSLNALQLAMGSDTFQVVTVSMDTGDDAEEKAQKYLTDNKLDALPGFIDAYSELVKIHALKTVPGIPATLILDQDMRVLARYQGDADWNGKEARAVLEYYQKNIEEHDPSKGVIRNY